MFNKDSTKAKLNNNEVSAEEQKKILGDLKVGAKVSFADAKKLIMPGGAGYPDTLLKNIDNITDLDDPYKLNEFVQFIVVAGGGGFVLDQANWDKLCSMNGFDRKATKEALILSRSMPLDEEYLKRIAFPNTIGELMNELAERKESGDYFRNTIQFAEDESLGEGVFKALKEKEYNETLKGYKNKFTSEVQGLIAKSLEGK